MQNRQPTIGEYLLRKLESCEVNYILGVLSLLCCWGCGNDEFDPPVVYHHSAVDITEIRVFAAIDRPAENPADIKMVLVGRYCAECLHYPEADYRQEGTRLFVRLGVNTETDCNCDVPLKKVSSEVSLRLSMGEYSVFESGKADGDPLIVFRVEADKVVIADR